MDVTLLSSLYLLNLGFGCISISSFSLSAEDEMILKFLTPQDGVFVPHLAFAAFSGSSLYLSCL